MTAKTQFRRGVFQQIFFIGGVNPVTRRTLSLVNRRMLINRGFNIIVNSGVQLLVASGTKLAAFFDQLKLVVGTVRIVTIVAIFTHRFMDELHAEFILAVLMAAKTKLSLCRRGDQQVFMLTGMGPMTGYTIPRPHRPMPVGFGKKGGLMTVEAKAADAGAVPAQLKTHRGFMGIMTIDTTVLYRFMHNAVIELLLLGLMADQTEILPGSLHGPGIEGAVRVVTGNADPGAHRSVHMGGLAHIGMAFPRSAIGPARHNLFKIILAAPLLVALLTVQSHGIAVDIKTFVTLGRDLTFLRRPIKNLHLLLELIGTQGDDILPFPEGNHRTKGAPVHRHNSTGGIITHAINGNPLDLRTGNGAGQKKLLPGYPSAIKRSNHGYFRLRGPSYRRGSKDTKPNKNTPCDKDALQQTRRRQWPVAALWITKNAFQVLFLPPLFFPSHLADE